LNAPEADPLDGGTLLDGRVQHRQRPSGHRTGIEPVVLAAAIPARPGERVLEAGTGSGAGLLCLAARVPGISGIGLELDPELAAIARDNVRRNGHERLVILEQDVASFRSVERFDHAFANPPWHAPDGTPSPDSGRERARRGTSGLLAIWARSLAEVLRHRGTLTFIVPSALLPACFAAMAAARCGAPRISPLWPRQGSAAKLVIVQSRLGARSPCVLLPGLVLHSGAGDFTDLAAAVLRTGAPLPL
jgi:tRNA1Val (adenine37-N6)-methyltransferase